MKSEFTKGLPDIYIYIFYFGIAILYPLVKILGPYL